MNVVCISDDSSGSSSSSAILKKPTPDSRFCVDQMDLTQDDDDEIQGTYAYKDVTSQKSLEKNLSSTDDCDLAFDQLITDTAGIVSRTDSGFSSGSSVVALKTTHKTKTVLKRRSVGNKEDRLRKKSDKAVEKEKRKQKSVEEKTAKHNALELNKIYKPGECMKYMTIKLHPALATSWWVSDLEREAAASGVRIQHDSQLGDEGFVVCSRSLPRTLTSNGGQMQLSSEKVDCQPCLCVRSAEQVAAQVRARMLADHVRALRDSLNCALTLVVYGIKDYFKSSRRKKQDTTNPITEIELEMAITDLLVSASCDTVLVNTPNELALLIVQHTKAIAEEPYKKSKRAFDEHAEFYMRGCSKNCVPIDKDGNGVNRLWQQMVATLPLSSLETARALCGKYKSPLDLYEALQMEDAVSDLADIGVSRAAVPGSRSRRLGPEFARRLQRLFTSDDGSLLLD